MSREEKPPAEAESEMSPDLPSRKSTLSGSSEMSADSEPVVAELVQVPDGWIPIAVEVSVGPQEVVDVSARPDFFVPPIPANLDNLSANGGAVAALVLGVWSFIGAFITNWSIINGLLGLMLGFWGITSRRRRMAWIGIVLCLISIALSMIQVSEIINRLMESADENI